MEDHRDNGNRVSARSTQSFRRLVVHGDHAPEWVLGRLRNGTDRLIADSLLLKDGDRCTVVRLDHGAEPLVLKRYNLKQPLHTATHFVLRSRAAWCWRNGHRLRRAGIATPEPVAYCEKRVGPLRLESYLVTTYVAGRTLRDFVASDACRPASLDRVARDFARIWRALGSLRADHKDMKASNFIVGSDGRLWLIDLDGVRLGLTTTLFLRARRRNLDRFMRNWQDRPEVAAAFRARLDTA